jgi:transcription elongation factor GreB
MSRGFVKEGDQEEAPFVPPRAPLPDGVANYVTPRGLALLHAERAELEKARAEATGGEAELRRTHAEIDARLALLQERIVTARVVEPPDQAPDEVRFGTTVHYREPDGTERRFMIVGVDEADVKQGRIAFTSPIARALIGKRAGDQATLQLGGGTRTLTVLGVEQER